MILVDGLVRKYGSNTAVNGISFRVGRREIIGFLGPNGAGKTTTLKVLAGCLYPSEGKVTIADSDITEHPIRCRTMIGYLPENNPLYEEMEVSEFLEWSAGVRSVPKQKRKACVSAAIEKCGLSTVIGKDIGQLSKGYRQRVGLARAILHDPPILLLDEPTAGLDPNQAAEVRRLISDLRREKTVLLSTHILSEVRSTCDKVIIIHRGQLAAQGSLEELSAGASEGQKIIFSLKTGIDAEKIKQKISSIEGTASVSHCAQAGEEIFSVSMKSSAEDGRSLIFRTAADNNWPLLELRKETVTLEEVFRSLTA